MFIFFPAFSFINLIWVNTISFSRPTRVDLRVFGLVCASVQRVFRHKKAIFSCFSVCVFVYLHIYLFVYVCP